MRADRYQLSQGDTVELGEVQAASASQKNGGLRLLVAHEGETTEYVILAKHYSTDGEEIDVPDSGEVLAVTEGQFATNPVAYVIVPTEAYGA